MGTLSTKGGSKSPTTSHNPSPPRPEGTKTDTKIQESKPELASSTEANRSLAPPPKPGTGADYFASKPPGSLSLELNPFEQSFGGPGPETPGGTKLPSVAALASPSSMLPGTGSTPFNWPGSLRSGPLSPAMLSGPATNDYFSDTHHFKGGFPTPNESSLRTGLTPGGNGSMFPAPSPGTTSLFASLNATGGATPNTLDFQRTALSAAAKRDRPVPPAILPPHNTSQPTQAPTSATMAPPTEPSHAYDHHDNDAANGLFMLAQARTGHGVQPYPPGPGPAPTSVPLTQQPAPLPSRVALPQQQPGASAIAGPSMTTSPVTSRARGASEASGASDESERLPHTSRTNQKRSSNASASTRRKAEDHPAKTPANKKVKMSSMSPNDDNMENFSDEDSMVKMEDANRGEDGDKTKMTDDEKRKNFLERNRVAALKCRQRKKQWLQSLQSKVELYNNENEALATENHRLKEEIVHLKTLLMGHKECSVTQQQQQQQGVPPGNAYAPAGPIDSFNGMPYGMAAPMPNHQTIIAGQSRRFS